MNDAQAAERMSELLHMLRGRVADAPSLKELAAMAGMSRFRFSRTFNAVVGMSMRAYIRHERVTLAADLLLRTTKQVTVIAVECGFYDLPHFDKAFRREVGVAPLSFRRQHRVAVPDRSIEHPPGPPADASRLIGSSIHRRLAAPRTVEHPWRRAAVELVRRSVEGDTMSEASGDPRRDVERDRCAQGRVAAGASAANGRSWKRRSLRFFRGDGPPAPRGA